MSRAAAPRRTQPQAERQRFDGAFLTAPIATTLAPDVGAGRASIWAASQTP